MGGAMLCEWYENFLWQSQIEVMSFDIFQQLQIEEQVILEFRDPRLLNFIFESSF